MRKILIIEDNDEVRENTAEILLLSDYEVLTATNGKEGVEIALAQHPDLIVCDIMMPVLDGYGVLHLLSKHEETATIPFIFLTAKAEKADPLLDKVTLETYEEGQVVQVLYTGDLADKQPAIEKMMAFALRQGFGPTGKYHEIYLDAPGSVAPDISRTILRQPLVPSQS